MIHFLENNGGNLKEMDINPNHTKDDPSLDKMNLTIARFCSNLESLCTRFLHNEARTLINILTVKN